MVAVTSPVDWKAAQDAVVAASDRLTALIRSASTPSAPALGEWDFTDLAVHISHALDAVNALAQGAGPIMDSIWDLGTMTKVLVGGEGKRPLGEIADRIQAGTTQFLDTVRRAGEAEVRTWFVPGSEYTVVNLTCHVLNELTVHGYDLARAQGVPWPIERSHAALILDGFLLPTVSVVGTSLLTPAGTKARAVFEIRVRGGGRWWFCFTGGGLTVTTARQARVDCHLSVDPEAFLLVSWGRIGQWGPILRGKLTAYGRKPWLGLAFRSWLRNP